MSYLEPHIYRPCVHLQGGRLVAAFGTPSVSYYSPLRAGLPYGCSTYCTPGRTVILRGPWAVSPRSYLTPNAKGGPSGPPSPPD